MGKRLGQGGFGEVYAAVDTTSGAPVAVKLLPEMDATSLARFQREVTALAMLKVPGVARLLGEGVDEGRPYLVMEHADGEPFPGDVPRRDWAFIGPRAARLFEIVGRIHAAGVVHRDLKPANVLVDHAGIVTVVDFGLARGAPLGPTITGTNLRMGTPRYVAPEQLLGQPVDGRTDLYAIGVMLHEALLGEAPFPDDDWRSASPQRLVSDAPPVGRRAPDLPWAAQRLIDRLLSRDPAGRPRSANHALGMLAEDRVPGVARLPWIGGRAPVDALVGAVRAGRPIDLWGPPGSGRSRCVAEALELLQAEGRTVLRARHGERPVESLRHFLDAEVAGAKGLGPFEKALRARLAAGDVLVVDVTDGIDAWSLSLVAHTRDAGAVIRVVDSPGAVRLERVDATALAPLFHGPDRVLHLREDAVLLLAARTDRLAGRISDELARWIDLGRATWDGPALRIDRSAIEAIQAEPIAEPASEVPALDRHLADILAWVELLHPVCTVEALATSTGLAPWEVEVDVEDLERRGAVRRLSDQRIEPTHPGASLTSAWDDEALKKARRVAAHTMVPGTHGRLRHLIAAEDVAESVAEALTVARAARAAGEDLTAARALDAVLAVDPTPPEALPVLAARAELAMQGRDLAVIAQLGARARLLVGDDPLTELLEAAVHVLSTEASATLDRLRALPALPYPALDGWRRVLAARAAIHAQDPDMERDIEAVRAVGVDVPGFAARADNLLGLVRYRQLRFTEAAERHEAAAAAASPGDRAAFFGNAAGARLATFDLAAARALAQASAEDAKRHRSLNLEARAEMLLRVADHQEGQPLGPDEEMITIARQLEHGTTAALMLGTEASIAWRAGDPRARDLAAEAVGCFGRTGMPSAALLWRALSYLLGEPHDGADLVADALACPLPWARLQALALVAATDRSFHPPVDARALTVGIPADRWDRRLEVLTAAEAVAILDGRSAAEVGLPPPYPPTPDHHASAPEH